MTLTVLEALLIFLVAHKRQAGYEIRQLFQATPLRLFSDSPGSIYPCLGRLEQRGLLMSSSPKGARRRRSYAGTPAGKKALVAWLSCPVDRSSRGRRDGELELRFVLIADTLGPARAITFLDEIETIWSAELAAIDVFMRGPGRKMSTASQASVTLGMRVTRLRIQWCHDIRNQIRRSS